LLGRLSVELYFSAEFERRDALSAEAVAAARRLDEPAALAAALAARHVAVWRPENLAERLELASELVAVASDANLLERELVGRHLHMIDRFETGDVSGVDDGFARCETLATELGQHSLSVQLAWFCAMRKMLSGDFEESERLTQHAFEQNLSSNESAAWMALGAQLFHLRREQGRLGEIEDVARQALTTQPHVGTTWRIALATILVESRRFDEARALVDEVTAGNLEQLRNALLRPIEIRELAEQIAVLEHREAAAVVDAHLDQFAGEVMLLGTGHLCAGPTSFARGLVLRTLGRTDDAIEQLAHAVQIADALGARPHSVRARWWLGRTLVDRGAPGDAERARPMLQSAATEAAGLGLAITPHVAAALASLS
jgi:tetratricopeptide (TPR) repeat protein